MLTVILIEPTMHIELSLAVPTALSLLADGPEVPTAVFHAVIHRGGVGDMSASDAPRS